MDLGPVKNRDSGPYPGTRMHLKRNRDGWKCAQRDENNALRGCGSIRYIRLFVRVLQPNCHQKLHGPRKTFPCVRTEKVNSHWKLHIYKNVFRKRGRKKERNKPLGPARIRQQRKVGGSLRRRYICCVIEALCKQLQPTHTCTAAPHRVLMALPHGTSVPPYNTRRFFLSYVNENSNTHTKRC